MFDDTPLVDQYSAWASGEPDYNFVKCVHMYSELDKLGKWNNIRCNLEKENNFTAPVVLCQERYI